MLNNHVGLFQRDGDVHVQRRLRHPSRQRGRRRMPTACIFLLNEFLSMFTSCSGLLPNWEA